MVGLTVSAVEYWDVHQFVPEPARWDYGTWHHAVMGVQLGTDRGPVTITWTNRFHPYGVDVLHQPIQTMLVLGDDGPERIGPDGASAWDQFLRQPIRTAVALWDVIGYAPAVLDGKEITPAEDVPLPIALRLDFDAGPVWFVAAQPERDDPEGVPFLPGDEIMVVFSEEKLRSMAIDPWSS